MSASVHTHLCIHTPVYVCADMRGVFGCCRTEGPCPARPHHVGFCAPGCVAVSPCLTPVKGGYGGLAAAASACGYCPATETRCVVCF